MIHEHEVLESTMTEAQRLAAGGAPHGSAVRANRQSRGRGQHGREWDSPEGGLWLSVVARPRRLDCVGTLSLRVALAVVDELESRLLPLTGLALKWPNDIMAGERKVAGVLTEACWSGQRCLWVVIGLGLNLLNRIPDTLTDQAGNLASLLPAGLLGELEPTRLAVPLAGVIADSAEGGELTASELQRWRARDWLAGREVIAPHPGTALGVDSSGSLIVRGGDGETHLVASGLVLPGRKREILDHADSD